MCKVNQVIYMNRNEVKKALEDFPVAVLPLGSTEQHGPHLPLGTDTFLAEELSRRICENTKALLLPAMPFGYSWVWRDIPGTATLPEKSVEMFIKDIAHSISRYGVKLLVLVNGHDANNSAMKYAVRELMDEIDMQIIYLFYPSLNDVLKENCESPTWYGMVHACEFETSLMLAVKPELVDMTKAVSEYPEKPDLYGKSTISLGDLSKSGVYGNPTLATREKGEKLLEIFVEKMTREVLEAYRNI